MERPMPLDPFHHIPDAPLSEASVADADDEMARQIRETVNVLNSLRIAARDRAMEFEIGENGFSKQMFVTITKHL